MPDEVTPRVIALDDVETYFKVAPSERTDLESLKVQIRGLSEPRVEHEVFVGYRAQNAMAAISQTLALADITCDDSPTERPSKMDAKYRGGKVVFRCYHNPAHEFEIQV